LIWSLLTFLLPIPTVYAGIGDIYFCEATVTHTIDRGGLHSKGSLGDTFQFKWEKIRRIALGSTTESKSKRAEDDCA
jgi:hypothetical protein